MNAPGQHDGTPVPAHLPRVTAEQAALSVDGTLAVVVVVSQDAEHLKRRVLLNLPSAQRAATRARDAGKSVEVVLVRLDPVGVVLP